LFYAAAAVPAWWEQGASPRRLGGSLIAGAVVALALAVWRTRAPLAFSLAALVFGIAGFACFLVFALNSGGVDYPEMPRAIGAVVYVSAAALAAGVGLVSGAVQRGRSGSSKEA
jgi:hypothetical protein